LRFVVCCFLFVVVARVREGWSWYAVMLFDLMELWVLLVEEVLGIRGLLKEVL